MPYVAPSTVTTLQTYTSAAHNIIVNDIIDHEARLNSYAGVYTNEAARDAAITSPVEGMRVYLTSPTVPSATGLSVNGLLTIYTGSVWRSAEPLTGTVNTSQDSAGTYGSWVNLATTGPVVTMVTGSSVMCSLSTGTLNNVGGNTNRICFAVSGATTVSAASVASACGEGIFYFSTGNVNVSIATNILLTGLTPGTNTFTMQYQTNANTQRYFWRHLTVTPLP